MHQTTRRLATGSAAIAVAGGAYALAHGDAELAGAAILSLAFSVAALHTVRPRRRTWKRAATRERG